MELTEKQVQKILCTASSNRILIITATDDEARIMRENITEYLRIHKMGTAVSRYQNKRGCIYFNGGFETIMIMPAFWWNEKFGVKRDFDGLVFVTGDDFGEIGKVKNVPTKIEMLWEEIK